MSEETSTIARCECGHEWIPRKPIAEMEEGPRCSECGALGEAITIEHDDSAQTSEDQNESQRLQRVKQRARREDIVDRVETNLKRIEAVTSSDDQVPQELQRPHRRFEILLEELQEEEPVPLDELDRVESYIENLEAELDDCPELSKIEDLDSQITTRQNELQRLDQKIVSREKELEDLEDKWKEAKSYGHVYRRGLKDAYLFVRENPTAGRGELVEAVDYPFDEDMDESEIEVV